MVGTIFIAAAIGGALGAAIGKFGFRNSIILCAFLGICAGVGIALSVTGTPSAVIAVQQYEGFDEMVFTSDIPVLVDFYADWCGPCRDLAPTIEMLAAEYEGKILFLKVDVDAQPKLSEEYGIRLLPTLMLFSEGQLANSWTGGRPASTFRFAFHEVLK